MTEPQRNIIFSEHLSSDVQNVNRPLHEDELRMLTFLLHTPNDAFAGKAALYAQLPYCTVVGILANGNPTIYLAVNSSRCAPADVKGRVPIEARWTAKDGLPGEVLLHVLDGYLAELELFTYGGLVRAIPPLEALELFNPEEFVW